MNLTTINWWAVVLAALSSFVVGGVWYSSFLFGKFWAYDNGISEETINKSNKAKIFGFTFVFSLIMSANLALFLNEPKTDTRWGIIAGFLTGIWTFCAIAIHSLFELKTWRLIFINGVYSIVALVIMGAIIGSWR
ncbi:DUF1761 domain-containing protein [Chitinophagaceae bacterium LWZ2-11]